MVLGRDVVAAGRAGKVNLVNAPDFSLCLGGELESTGLLKRTLHVVVDQLAT